MSLVSEHGGDFEIIDPRFALFVLDNAPLEELASGFRWLEGLLWLGDMDQLLFQDLPRDRTMRWIEDTGVSTWRAPSGFANGQARDREGRVVFCSHRRRRSLSRRARWSGDHPGRSPRKQAAERPQ